MTDKEKRYARKHDGETTGVCKRCGKPLSVENPRYVGENPYVAEILEESELLDACEICAQEFRDDI